MLKGDFPGSLEDSLMHTLHIVACPSAALNTDVPMAVLVPPDYAISNRRYAVLTLLHGISDTFMCWLDYTNIRRYLDTLRLIVVMPECGRSFYINTVDGRHYEDFLVNDLIAFMDGEYPTLATPTTRGIGGLSMGGYGALMLALRHRDVWSAAFSHSGAVGAPHWVEDAPNVSVFGPMNSAKRQEHDLWRLIDAPADNFPQLHFDCGLDDFLLDENRAFHHSLQARSLAHVYREHPGGHTWDYCDEHLPSSIDWLTRVLAGECNPELDGMTVIEPAAEPSSFLR